MGKEQIIQLIKAKKAFYGERSRVASTAKHRNINEACFNAMDALLTEIAYQNQQSAMYFSEARRAEAERRMDVWQRAEAEKHLRHAVARQDWRSMDIEQLKQVAAVLGIEHNLENEE